MTAQVTAIIQARMTSTRLPGKVMKPVLGKPLLAYLIERLKDCRHLKSIILATTENAQDDPVADLAGACGLSVFRGSEHNVLDRFFQAAAAFGGDPIMRITADCPLIDPDLLDQLAEFYLKGRFDYASNCSVPTLPDGLDAEIFSLQALTCAYEKARRPSCLEHVTPYICNHPKRFKLGSWTFTENLSHHRWTVDEPEDFAFVAQVLEHLYPVKTDFRTRDILDLLDRHPVLLHLNSHFTRNEGYLKSIEADRRWRQHETV